MYKLLLQPKKNQKFFHRSFTYPCCMQKAPMHEEETWCRGKNKKKNGIIQISFVQKSQVKQHTQIKHSTLSSSLLSATVANVLKNKL